MLDFVLNFLFPPSCIVCGKFNKYYICEKCNRRFDKYRKFNLINNKKLIMDKLNIKDNNFIQNYYLVGNQKIYWEELLYAFEYKNIVRKYIIKYKFFNESYLSNFFAYQILNNKKVNEKIRNYDIIIPVPMSNKKRKKRGYNQTELIAKIIAQNSNLRYVDALEKVKETKTQSLLDLEKRKENIKNAFNIKDTNMVKNKNIVLFDDIFTTGSTINEIAQILKKAGAKNIFALVIAKD